MACLPSCSTILVYSLSSIPREQVDQIIQNLIQAGANASLPSPSAATTHDSHPTSRTPIRGPRPWTIRNKYYTCDVQFVHVPRAEDEEGSRDDQDRYQVQGDEPAVIVVAPPTQTPPTDLANVLSSLAARDPEFDIALLLTSSPSPTDQDQVSSPPNDQAWDDLCLNHAFEYVRPSSSSSSSALNSTSPSTFKPEADDDDRGDKTGTERVIEALQSRIWERMIPSPTEFERTEQETAIKSHESSLFNVRLPPPSLPKAKEYSPVRVEWPERFLPNLVAKEGSKDQGERGGFDDDFAEFVSGPSGAEVERWDEISSASTSLPPRSSSGSDAEEDADDFASLERQDQELESLFAQLSTAREQALGIKDLDQKRAFAEKTVLSLLG
ncbi:BZ3500_MvSof-1268-A1-R1_Chr2-1g04622 [Microbotryum saponariae]|uniref:BZ3500_MvSof-1268-A1-R1_Chr2-1g04622 protein n=1 Tax=Microbotryum saponariae TaxID=289078 RepID=A0A2X0MAG5_9BASI|nr:BZ3500_MvSof-1268-A1-R1_Chr2-1g04622 [Microbotryum saponariae]SCZ92142.1 BZ3501_MvSof-1269-A2-R1_Chr2-1g04278 [Microbotryum saponariae]